MLLRKIVDKLLYKNCLADTSATEEACLTAAHIGFQEVDGLDASLEDLGRSGEVLKGRRRMMYGVVEHVFGNPLPVDRLSHDVPDATQGKGADRHHHGSPRIMYHKTALQAIGG